MRHNIEQQLFDFRVSDSAFKNSKHHVYSVQHWSEGDPHGVVPAPLAENFGYGFADEAEAWSWMIQVRETHPDGKKWEVDPKQKQSCAVHLYGLLSDICVNEDDEIESDFIHFDKGTDRADIWHWLESEFDVQLAQLEGLVTTPSATKEPTMTIEDWYNEATLAIPSTHDGLEFNGWQYSSSYKQITVTYGFGHDSIEVYFQYNPDTQEWTSRYH